MTTARDKFKNIDPKEMKTMTKLEIAEKIRCSVPYAETLVKEFKREFIRVPNNSIYYAKVKRSLGPLNGEG